MVEPSLSFPVAPERSWTVGGRRPLGVRMPAGLMGIVNVTPDSFSDGGKFGKAEQAVAAAQQMIADGAEVIDVGGESSRPGAAEIPATEEIARIVPVIEGIRRANAGIPISVDTCKAAVARAAIAAGADLVNDIAAGADPDMFPLVAETRAGIVLMHMQGTPRTMQTSPRYDHVVDEVIAFLRRRLEAATAAGIPESAVLLDPGIGFGKTLEHNLALLRALPRFAHEFARPLVVGISRKSFLSALCSPPVAAADRDAISHAVHTAIAPWCALLRVHDVRGARAACDRGHGGASPRNKEGRSDISHKIAQRCEISDLTRGLSESGHA
jgi:dihydropteroate synthase